MEVHRTDLPRHKCSARGREQRGRAVAAQTVSGTNQVFMGAFDQALPSLCSEKCNVLERV